MKDSRRLAVAALVLGLAACVMAEASWREARVIWRRQVGVL